MVKKTEIVGGQAVIEGVMMRFGNQTVTSVRKKSGIVSRDDSLNPSKLSKIPFIRGIYNLFTMLILGTKTLLWSAQIHDDMEEEIISPLEWVSIFGTSFLFMVIFFLFLPYFFTRLLFSGNGIVFSLLEGVIRIAIFIIYLLAIAQMKDIKRVFQYHGAEHKAVNCYESVGSVSKMTKKKLRESSRIHPRCGTGFIFVVLIISVIVFSILPTYSFLIRIPLKLVLLPFVASISYEILIFSFKHPNNKFFKLFIMPGLLFQRVTTNEPDDQQLEVAVDALKKVL